MLTCYLVSNLGHSICGTCQSRQENQSATKCPVCNTTLLSYIPNIALTQMQQELNVAPVNFAKNNSQLRILQYMGTNVVEFLCYAALVLKRLRGNTRPCLSQRKSKLLEWSQHDEEGNGASPSTAMSLSSRTLSFSVWIGSFKLT